MAVKRAAIESAAGPETGSQAAAGSYFTTCCDLVPVWMGDAGYTYRPGWRAASHAIRFAIRTH